MRALMVRLKPTVFEDIIALVALYRPGPMESGMHDDYVRRKHGESKVEYFLPQMEPILRETYGVILYQEQVMQIAAAVSGFSLAEADLLRRAMGKKDPAVMAAQRDRFVSGAVRPGGGQGQSQRSYSPSSKSLPATASINPTAPPTPWWPIRPPYLKAHYPLEFLAAVLNSEINNSTALAKHIMEARDQRDRAFAAGHQPQRSGLHRGRRQGPVRPGRGEKCRGGGHPRHPGGPGRRPASRASGMSWSGSIWAR